MVQGNGSNAMELSTTGGTTTTTAGSCANSPSRLRSNSDEEYHHTVLRCKRNTVPSLRNRLFMVPVEMQSTGGAWENMFLVSKETAVQLTLAANAHYSTACNKAAATPPSPPSTQLPCIASMLSSLPTTYSPSSSSSPPSPTGRTSPTAFGITSPFHYQSLSPPK
jgi:hypothetical protein